jgi:hypothetical protein
MSSLTPNLAHAQAFLTALDEGSDAWTFQTFPDDGRRSKDLTHVLHGGLETHGRKLEALNARGAGVFVTINETDGYGRTKANITKIRAMFVDLDGAPIEPLRKATAPPHIVVETSPGRFHAYWRVSGCSLDACEPALKQLIKRYGADASCSDRCRVLRLPGFIHRKTDPFLVHVIDTSPGECSLEDLEVTEYLQKRQKVLKMTSDSSVSSVGICRFLPEAEGQRNRCLFDLARYLKGVMPNATSDELRRIVMHWHTAALPVIGTADFSESWGDFRRGWEKVHTPFGSILESVMKKIDMNSEMSEEIKALGYGEKAHSLIRICHGLQDEAGNAPFFLSARQAGELIKMHFTDAANMMYALVSDGVIELVERGSGKKASRYRLVTAAPGQGNIDIDVTNVAAIGISGIGESA